MTFTYCDYQLFKILPGILSYVPIVLIFAGAIFFRNKYPQLIENFPKFVFGKFLKEKDDDGAYVIFGFKAPKYYIFWLFSVLFQLLGITVLLFWQVFLLEESYMCRTDELLDCFSSNASGSDLPLDCSNTIYLDENNITSFTCYMFVFRLEEASGAALGIFTIAEILFTIVTWLLLKVSNGKAGTRFQKGLTILIQMAGIIGTTTGYLIIIFVIASRRFGSVRSIFEIILLYLTTVSCFSTPWWGFTKVTNE